MAHFAHGQVSRLHVSHGIPRATLDVCHAGIYPLSRIPEGWRWLAVVNPMAIPVEAIKRIFLGQGVVEPAYVAVSVIMTLVLLLSGIVVFNKVEKTFVDTV